ncbi:hypothetical protein WDU94_003242 [Cyamophila willieti]
MFVLIHKAGVVLCVASIASVIVWYTPLPVNTFPECNRPCHELDWPMICRFKLHVQYSESLTLCHNHTLCTNEDGLTKSCSTNSCEHLEHVYLINGKILGPTIQVCKNDILVIDIINHLPARSLAFHWHGQLVRETPSMDGIAMITQCPVLSHTVYQYKLRAAQAGTHYYHALTGDPVLDQSLQGGLIVRESEREEVHIKLYNEDRVSHTVHLTQHKDLLFVNGKSLESGFIISSNTQYRFRLIHGGACPLVFSIVSHPLLVIALDGAPIQPKLTEAIEFVPGERIDFIVNADKPIGSYAVHIRSSNLNCAVTLGGDVHLVYNGSHSGGSSKLESGKIRSKVIEDRKVSKKYGKVELLSTIQSLSLSKSITLEKLQPASSQAEQEETQPSSVLEVTLEYYKTDFNNVSFIFPPSPLVSQLDQVDPLSLCSSTDETNLPHLPCTQEKLCHCTHLIRVPLHAVVQVTLVDKGNTKDNIFHLHGHKFQMVKRSTPNTNTITNIVHKSKSSVVDNQSDVLIVHNDIEDTSPQKNIGTSSVKHGPDSQNSSPTSRVENNSGSLSTSVHKMGISKDTLFVGKGQSAILRFRADNPGFWSLHSVHNLQHQVLFHVGDISDLPPTPENFPTCGSYVGPDFFLI